MSNSSISDLDDLLVAIEHPLHGRRDFQTNSCIKLVSLLCINTYLFQFVVRKASDSGFLAMNDYCSLELGQGVGSLDVH